MNKPLRNPDKVGASAACGSTALPVVPTEPAAQSQPSGRVSTDAALESPAVRVAELVRAVNHYGRPFLENSKVRTPITVESGPWSGYQVRRARKVFKCDDRCGYWLGGGQLYLQGEVDPYRAGGFGHDRICLKCAGPMVLHAIAQAVEDAPNG